MRVEPPAWKVVDAQPLLTGGAQCLPKIRKARIVESVVALMTKVHDHASRGPARDEAIRVRVVGVVEHDEPEFRGDGDLVEGFRATDALIDAQGIDAEPRIPKRLGFAKECHHVFGQCHAYAPAHHSRQSIPGLSSTCPSRSTLPSGRYRSPSSPSTCASSLAASAIAFAIIGGSGFFVVTLPRDQSNHGSGYRDRPLHNVKYSPL